MLRIRVSHSRPVAYVYMHTNNYRATVGTRVADFFCSHVVVVAVSSSSRSSGNDTEPDNPTAAGKRYYNTRN